jgi:uncharacterized membrane protein YeaQ/YmgE (transglycosylase-associated protein family)
MVILSWLGIGLIAGGLAGLLLGQNSDIVADTMFGMIGGMAGGCVSLVLLMVSGTGQGVPLTILGIAFAVFLIAVTRIYAHATGI